MLHCGCRCRVGIMWLVLVLGCLQEEAEWDLSSHLHNLSYFRMNVNSLSFSKDKLHFLIHMLGKSVNLQKCLENRNFLHKTGR